MKKQDYCQYYQAKVDKKTTWFIGGLFKAESNVAFLRAVEGKQHVHEFFVPLDQEEYFLSLMDYLEKNGYVGDIKLLPNRLIEVEANSITNVFNNG